MKKATPFIVSFFVFLSSLLYLHQKIQIYVEAYRLSANYRHHNELIDKKDYLMYNFTKEMSLVKINQWAQEQRFIFAGKEKSFALKPKKSSNKIVMLFDGFLRASTPTAEAFVKKHGQ